MSQTCDLVLLFILKQSGEKTEKEGDDAGMKWLNECKSEGEDKG